jgi:hypothetical protein
MLLRVGCDIPHGKTCQIDEYGRCEKFAIDVISQIWDNGHGEI